MTANRLLLLLNSLLLLLILGQRTQAEGGHLGWLQALPWSSFGTELADLSSQAQVSAGAVLCLWLVLSAGWLLISLMVERQQRRAAAHASAHASNGAAAPHASDAAAHGAPNINMEDDASIQQVLARLQKNVPDLSPEARAELARLRAALQTLSDPETKS